MKPSERKYTGVLQYFHNYEHDPEGRTHCTGPASNPYKIVHKDGKHFINTEYAVGHGKNVERQWFKFTKKIDGLWDMSSSEKVDKDSVPEKGKKPVGSFEDGFNEGVKG